MLTMAPPPPPPSETATAATTAATTAVTTKMSNNTEQGQAGGSSLSPPVPSRTTAASTKKDATTTNPKPAAAASSKTTDLDLLDQTLYRLTQGLPKSELRLMVSEADECEKALKDEIAILERALQQQQQQQPGSGGGGGTANNVAAAASKTATTAENSSSNSNSEIQAILESALTPMDRYWTFSALVGRLQQGGDDDDDDDLFALPSLFAIRDEKHPDHAKAMQAMAKYQYQKQQQEQPQRPTVAAASSATSTSASASMTASTKVENATTADTNNNKTLLALMDNPAYRRTETFANILACWKKIHSNRAAIVFRKAVKPEEAPGYTERIKYPIDLSLIRKMIVTRHVQSYADLHKYIGLISHNCCKYNGKESDYGMVARDFEAMADQIIRTTVVNAAANANAESQQQQQQQQQTATTTGTDTTTKVPASTAAATDSKILPPTKK